MDAAIRAAELIVGTSVWKSDSHGAYSFTYSLSKTDNQDIASALKTLKIQHEVQGDRIVVSGFSNLVELYEHNADLPGFGDHVSGRGM